MGFDVQNVMQQMIEAITNEVSDSAGDVKVYAEKVMKKKEASLKELALARVAGEIDDDILKTEIEREKKVIEAELLTVEIMTKALAQRAVNEAIDVFYTAVKAAI